jgi:hypothetical protein
MIQQVIWTARGKVISSTAKNITYATAEWKKLLGFLSQGNQWVSLHHIHTG